METNSDDNEFWPEDEGGTAVATLPEMPVGASAGPAEMTVEDLRRAQELRRREWPKDDGQRGPLEALAASFDAMLAAAPETVAQAELMPDAASPAPETRTISTANGWPERYVGPRSELTGREWLDAFRLAIPTVESGGILILHGKRGTGKTRMASELARAARYPMSKPQMAASGIGHTSRKVERQHSVYRTAMRIFLELRDSYRKDSQLSELQVIDSLIEPGLLVIDELQERGETAFENQKLTHILDARYGAMRSTVIIANLTREELEKTLGTSICDRIAENGRRIDFTWESYRRRRK